MKDSAIQSSEHPAYCQAYPQAHLSCLRRLFFLHLWPGVRHLPQPALFLMIAQPIQRLLDLFIISWQSNQGNRIQCCYKVIPPERMLESDPVARRVIRRIRVWLKESGFQQMCGDPGRFRVPVARMHGEGAQDHARTVVREWLAAVGLDRFRVLAGQAILGRAVELVCDEQQYCSINPLLLECQVAVFWMSGR